MQQQLIETMEDILSRPKLGMLHCRILEIKFGLESGDLAPELALHYLLYLLVDSVDALLTV